MTKNEIETAVFEALRRIAPEVIPRQIDPKANLREAAEIDSFDFLNFLIELHKRLGVEIPEADYAKVATLETLVRYLEAK